MNMRVLPDCAVGRLKTTPPKRMGIASLPRVYPIVTAASVVVPCVVPMMFAIAEFIRAAYCSADH
jgi:hypothetical protein